MDELKKLLEAISRQLEGIDLKLAVIANASQGPAMPGQTQYHFGTTAFPTVPPGPPPQS